MGSDVARRAAHGRVATALSLVSDRELAEIVDAAPVVGSGVGGTTALLEVEGTPVFVKRVPLTEIELRPENVRSTANLFGLPPHCQYGVGGPSVNGWRELAANVLTTDWVLTGQAENFPLMYHWRVLPGLVPPVPVEWADLDRAVEFWHGSAAVRARIEALTASTTAVVLFLEHVPYTLHEWLTGLERSAVDAACAMVERELRASTDVLDEHGLLHFDAHVRNVLTDGHRLYVADFGLATSCRFDLSAAEAEFALRHVDHDRAYVLTQLANWLVTALTGPAGPAERNAYLRRCAQGGEPAAHPVVARLAPVASIVNDFYWTLHTERRTVPYPAEAIERAGH